MAKKKTDTGYKAAVFGAKGVIKILLYLLALFIIIYLSKTAYSTGYAVFNQEAMAEAPGQAVTVIVPKDASAGDIGKILERKGLVKSAGIFKLQERLSIYHDKLKAGTYLLNTSETPDDMMAILSGENTEGQISDEDKTDTDDEKTDTGTEDDAVQKVE